jgi:hypothetical protein
VAKGKLCGEARWSTTTVYHCSWRVMEWQHLSVQASVSGMMVLVDFYKTKIATHFGKLLLYFTVMV